jgi:hypothetical protein
MYVQIGMFKVESCKVDTRRIEDDREVRAGCENRSVVELY